MIEEIATAKESGREMIIRHRSYQKCLLFTFCLISGVSLTGFLVYQLALASLDDSQEPSQAINNVVQSLLGRGP